MSRIRMYTTRWCGYCVRAKALLESKGLPYEEINLDDDPHFRQKLCALFERTPEGRHCVVPDAPSDMRTMELALLLDETLLAP